MQNRSEATLPPEIPGKPLVGNALDFNRNPIGLFKRGFDTYGPIFSINLGRVRAAVLIGPDNNRFFFEQTDKILSMREVYQFLIPMFGKEIFFAAGPETYKKQRELMLPAFSGQKMPGYVAAMSKETLDWLETLGDQGQFDLVTSMEKLTMYIAARAILGDDFRQRMGDEFAGLYRQLGEGIEFLLPSNLPLPKFRRRDRAKAQLEKMITEIIAERRANRESLNDFLQVFIESRYPDGSLPSNDVITSLVLGMVFAGHETTAGHACWGLIQLLQNLDFLRSVVKEVDDILQYDEALDIEQVRRMDRLEWALKETERMRPVTTMLMRYNLESYELSGYHIPKGWLTVISPAISHRMPEFFDHPSLYDPLRFAPGREEQRRHQFSLVGFGGGRHKCLGMNFAYHEMKVIFSLLFHRYNLELVDPDPKRDPKIKTNRPVRPCWIRYQIRT